MAVIKAYAPLVGVVVIVLVGAGLWVSGRSSGFEACRADVEFARMETQKRLFDLSNTISRQAADLEIARLEQEELANALEDAARNDPDNRRLGVGPDGLRRIERRWAAP